jgi:predicted component of type VI protein secretion system
MDLLSSNSAPISASDADFDLPELDLTQFDGTRRTVRLRPGMPSLTIGRSRQNAVTVRDTLVSAQHLQLEVRLDGVHLADLGSRHGTQVNGQVLPNRESRPLRDGDDIRIGRTRIRFKCYSERINDVCVSPGPATTVETECEPGHESQCAADVLDPFGSTTDAMRRNARQPGDVAAHSNASTASNRMRWPFSVEASTRVAAAVLLCVGVGIFVWFVLGFAEFARGRLP